MSNQALYSIYSDDPSRLPGLVDPRSGGVQHAEGTRGAPVSDAEREELEERMAMGKISHCMASYRSIVGAENARQRWNISRLPEHRRTLLPGLATRVAVRSVRAHLSAASAVRATMQGPLA